MASWYSAAILSNKPGGKAKDKDSVSDKITLRDGADVSCKAKLPGNSETCGVSNIPESYRRSHSECNISKSVTCQADSRRPASVYGGHRDSGRPGSATGCITCDDHPEMTLTTFCPQHDSVLCDACVEANHRFCTNLSSILQQTTGVELKSKDLKKSVKELEEIRSKVQKMKQNKQEEIKKLNDETDAALKDLAEFKELIIWALERLDSKGKRLIEKRRQELYKPIKEDFDMCSEMLASVDKELERAKKKDEGKNKSFIRFVKLKKSGNVLQKAKSNVDSMRNSASNTRPMIKLTIDPRVEKFARNLWWYGKDRTYLSSEPGVVFPHLYSVKADTQFDVRTKGERNVCAITDGCQMPEGTCLLIDEANQSIKQLDIHYELVDVLKLPLKPLCVCQCGEEKAAVALDSGDNSILQLVTVGSRRLSLLDSFTLHGKCTGLAFDGCELIAAFSHSILAYTLQGEHTRTVVQDENVSIHRLCLNPTNKKLWVMCNGNRLMAMNKDGDIKGSVQLEHTQEASAIALDNGGQALVAGNDSGGVALYKHDFEYLGIVANENNGIKAPSALVFDRLHTRLIVGMKGKNVVKVLELK